MRKPLSVALAACLLLTGCASGGNSSVKDVRHEDLPYGATLAFNQNTVIASQYDSRFITTDMRDAVLKYYHAIEMKDEDAFVSAQMPLWHDYTVNTVYGGVYTDLQLMKTKYDACAKVFGGSFRFAEISIEEAEECAPGSEGQQVLFVLDQLAADKNEPKVSEESDGIWQLNVTRYLDVPESNTRGETKNVRTDDQLYLISWRSEWYVIIN